MAPADCTVVVRTHMTRVRVVRAFLWFLALGR